MRLIKKKTLDRFVERHPDAEASLSRLYGTILDADWSAPSQVRDSIRTADVVGDFIIFNINGNAYRLVVRADYRRQILLCLGLLHPRRLRPGRLPDDRPRHQVEDLTNR